MPKVKILSPGKSKEQWLIEALDEYSKRLKPYLDLELIWTKDDEQLLRFAEKENSIICLDVDGALMSSVKFADFFHKQLEISGARLTFIIGGAEGLPPSLKEKHPLLSLSRLTLTHQCTRLILVEQIYRAIEIERGSSYHK